MAKFANQFKVTIGNRLRDTNHPYVLMGVIPFQRACQELDQINSLKLWLYLSHNQDGFELDLSQKAAEAWGIKRSSYYRAVEQLIEKGYLVAMDEKHFRFKEIPEVNFKYDF